MHCYPKHGGWRTCLWRQLGIHPPSTESHVVASSNRLERPTASGVRALWSSRGREATSVATQPANRASFRAVPLTTDAAAAPADPPAASDALIRRDFWWCAPPAVANQALSRAQRSPTDGGSSWPFGPAKCSVGMAVAHGPKTGGSTGDTEQLVRCLVFVQATMAVAQEHQGVRSRRCSTHRRPRLLSPLRIWRRRCCAQAMVLRGSCLPRSSHGWSCRWPMCSAGAGAWAGPNVTANTVAYAAHLSQPAIYVARSDGQAQTTAQSAQTGAAPSPVLETGLAAHANKGRAGRLNGAVRARSRARRSAHARARLLAPALARAPHLTARHRAAPRTAAS